LHIPAQTGEHAAVRARIISALALAVLVAAFSASVRLDAAADTVADLGARPGLTPDGLGVVWALLTAATAGLAAGVLVAAVRRTGARRLAWTGGASIAAWVVWQVLGIVTVGGTEIGALRTWAFAATVVAALVALVAAARVLPGSALGAWATGRSVVRIQLLLLGLLFLFVFRFPFVSDQLADVLRAWGDGPWSRAVAGVGAALLLGAVIRTSAARLLLPETGRETLAGAPPAPDWRLRAAAGAGVLAAAGVLWTWLDVQPLATILALAALLVLLSVRAGQAGATRAGDADRIPLRRLAGVLGVVPVAILLVGLAAALTDSLLLPGAGTSGTAWLAVITALAIVLLAVVAVRALDVDADVRDNPAPGRLWRERGAAAAGGLVVGALFAAAPGLAALALLGGALVFAVRAFAFTSRGGIVLYAAFGTGLGVAVAVYAEPLEATRGAGAFGLVFAALALVLALLHQAASAAARREPVARVEGWPQRVPVVLPLLVWGVVAWATMPATLHQARTVAAPDPVGTQLADEVDAWLGGTPRGRTVPMLLVAASGGGAKAAYWTDLVVDCLAGRGVPAPRHGDECEGSSARLDRLFLTSSVSGGSVGVHHLLTRWDDVRAGRPWVHDAQRDEVLSPPVGWGLFHDLPAFLLGLHLDPSTCATRLGCDVDADRALIQEAAIGASDTPLREQDGPLAVFNAAAAGRRVLLSRAALAPNVDCPGGNGAVDGRDALDDADVALGTAAILSARFPGVSPAGRLGTEQPAVPGLCATDQTQAALDLRDGGYVENSGVLTIVDLLPAIRAAAEARGHDVWPIVVSADDDVPKVTGDDEFRGGPFGFGEPARRTVRARNRLKHCELPGASYVRVSPPAHVGAQAATGWEVSALSRRGDLVAGLAAQRDTLDAVRAALDGDITALPRC
jgi:hypothetical protein